MHNVSPAHGEAMPRHDADLAATAAHIIVPWVRGKEKPMTPAALADVATSGPVYGGLLRI